MHLHPDLSLSEEIAPSIKKNNSRVKRTKQGKKSLGLVTKSKYRQTPSSETVVTTSILLEFSLKRRSRLTYGSSSCRSNPHTQSYQEFQAILGNLEESHSYSHQLHSSFFPSSGLGSLPGSVTLDLLATLLPLRSHPSPLSTSKMPVPTPHYMCT